MRYSLYLVEYCKKNGHKSGLHIRLEMIHERCLLCINTPPLFIELEKLSHTSMEIVVTIQEFLLKGLE